ncbi:MAG TPA: hypothetical protein DCL57_04505 [Microbacterium sp.]|nr:hypothetical protein [Microbacterium sp.]
MADKKTTTEVTLSTPIQHGSETIATLTFRRPRAGDMRGVKLTIGEAGVTLDMGALLDLAAAIAEQPPSVMEQLELDDAAAVVAAIVPLLPSGLARLASS